MGAFERVLNLLFGWTGLVATPPVEPEIGGNPDVEPELKLALASTGEDVSLGSRAAAYLSIQFGMPLLRPTDHTVVFNDATRDTVILDIPPKRADSQIHADNFAWTGAELRFRFIFYGKDPQLERPVCCWFGFSIEDEGNEIIERHLTDLSRLSQPDAAACVKVYEEWAHAASHILRRRFREANRKKRGGGGGSGKTPFISLCV